MGFCRNSAETSRKFAKKYVWQCQERVQKFCGKFAEIWWKFAEHFLQWPLPKQPHKRIADLWRNLSRVSPCMTLEEILRRKGAIWDPRGLNCIHLRCPRMKAFLVFLHFVADVCREKVCYVPQLSICSRSYLLISVAHFALESSPNSGVFRAGFGRRVFQGFLLLICRLVTISSLEFPIIFVGKCPEKSFRKIPGKASKG